MVAPVQRLDQAALVDQGAGAGSRQPVGPGDVDREQLAPRRPRCDPCAAPQQGLALGAAGERDDDPLAGLPQLVDPVRGPVLLQAVLDLVGQPEQGQLAQGRQVADPEVVRQRRVDLVGRVDVAVGQPATQRLGRGVDELDLVRGPDHGVGDRLALRDAGDLGDDVVQRLQVLDVDGGDDIDPGLEDLLDVLPALLVARARDVGVGELVDQGHGRMAGDDRVGVHLLDSNTAVFHAWSPDTRSPCVASPPGLRPSPGSAVGRGPRRTPRRCRYRARSGGAPPRAWRTSYPPRAQRRGRSAAGLVPSGHQPPSRARARFS